MKRLSAMGKTLIALTLLIALTACAGATPSQRPSDPELPYRTWEIGLLAPNYMEVWVESVDVVDQRGFAYERVHGGTSSIQNPPENRGNPSGWPGMPGAGKTRPMTGVDLPTHLFVRWQSLVEPQTYNVRLDIPEEIRREMLEPREVYCAWRDAHVTQYRNIVSIGLAPGGVAKAWLNGGCLDSIEIGRFQGVVEPKGPYGGTSGGEYYRPPSEHAQHYLDTHEIPFESW
tara:strand:- start:32 stop:721 length:690 start_codon:yes stop_codon:yes gene_type:complete